MIKEAGFFLLTKNLTWDKQIFTSIWWSDLKRDRSKGRLLSWMLLVPTGTLLPRIWQKKKGNIHSFISSKTSILNKRSDKQRNVTFRYRSLHMKSRMWPRSVLASPLQLVGLAKRSCWETAWSCSGRTMKTLPSWSNFSPTTSMHTAHSDNNHFTKQDQRWRKLLCSAVITLKPF